MNNVAQEAEGPGHPAFCTEAGGLLSWNTHDSLPLLLGTGGLPGALCTPHSGPSTLSGKLALCSFNPIMWLLLSSPVQLSTPSGPLFITLTAAGRPTP